MLPVARRTETRYLGLCCFLLSYLTSSISFLPLSFLILSMYVLLQKWSLFFSWRKVVIDLERRPSFTRVTRSQQTIMSTLANSLFSQGKGVYPGPIFIKSVRERFLCWDQSVFFLPSLEQCELIRTDGDHCSYSETLYLGLYNTWLPY